MCPECNHSMFLRHNHYKDQAKCLITNCGCVHKVCKDCPHFKLDKCGHYWGCKCSGRLRENA